MKAQLAKRREALPAALLQAYYLVISVVHQAILVLTHPRQREGQESWKDDVERIALTAEH